MRLSHPPPHQGLMFRAEVTVLDGPGVAACPCRGLGVGHAQRQDLRRGPAARFGLGVVLEVTPRIGHAENVIDFGLTTLAERARPPERRRDPVVCLPTRPPLASLELPVGVGWHAEAPRRLPGRGFFAASLLRPWYAPLTVSGQGAPAPATDDHAAHAGVSAAISSGFGSGGPSKNVATNTVSPAVGLKAEWTWPCPGSTNAVPARYACSPQSVST